jgi:polyphosphate kinase 2 (PPK2 family)
MLARTDSSHAPWSYVSANDKRAARLEVLSTLRDRIAERLGKAARPLEASEPARSA